MTAPHVLRSATPCGWLHDREMEERDRFCAPQEWTTSVGPWGLRRPASGSDEHGRYFGDGGHYQWARVALG
jgi:hypothetical protein